MVDLVSEWHDGSSAPRPTSGSCAYEQPRGCAAAYYPETNPLVPLDSTAEGSNTPTSKSVVVRLERPGGRRNRRHAATAAGGTQETGHKRQTDPVHQS